MLKRTLKSIAARLPLRYQQLLKRRYFASHIRNRKFRTNEPEFDHSSMLLREGDWALDIGANIGHYTLEFSRLVGPSGRVVAFEPVPETFELLASNVAYSKSANVTLINAAASDSTRLLGMEIPKHESGLDDYYMASVKDDTDGLSVLSVSVDSLELPNPVRLVKVDAEGHDLIVLKGMSKLLRRDTPILIVEESTEDLISFLDTFNYSMHRLEGSPNVIFEVEPP